MSNLDKLKKIWLDLENTYAGSGMSSKKDFLMKYLGYRDGTSGLPKLLMMLQRSCEFNEDHEPLPEYKDDYELLNRILNNADKLVQSECDFEEMDLDDIENLYFEQQGQAPDNVQIPTTKRNANSINIVSAIIMKFANSHYNVKTKKHMELPCINDKAALVRRNYDYKNIVTYLTTKIACDKSETFDQLLFRYIIKNNVKSKKYPLNIVFLDSSEFDIEDGNIVLHANKELLCSSENVKSEKRSGDLISYQGFKKCFPEYTIYKGKTKELFDKTYTIIGFKYE